MWIEIKDVHEMNGTWVSEKVLAPVAYITVSEYTFKHLNFCKDNGARLAIREMNNIIGVVGDEAKKLGFDLVISNFNTITTEQEKNLLETLKKNNFALNAKGRVCFYDLQDICFEIEGNILSYDEFCKYELPEGKVYKRVYDNGYSYIGSDPFHVTSKGYADAAIKAAKEIDCVWSGWQHGFRLNKVFCIDVAYGNDESYHEVSFS